MDTPFAPRRFIQYYLITALSLFACALRLTAQEIQPPDLWDIATGEQITGAEVLKTKDFGAIVSAVKGYDSAAKKGGIRDGDIILGVDGMRTFDKREYLLARNRNPISSTITLLINRNGDLEWHKLHNLAPGHRIGLYLDARVEQDRFLNEVESLGLPVADDKVVASLHLLPGHAAAALDVWETANKSSAQDNTAWVQDFIDLYTAVQGRHYSKATMPAHQPPIPYFQRLEKFYLALATANQPREIPPDLLKSGESPEFCTLAVPVPFCTRQLGNVHFTDLRFNLLLAKAYSSQERPDPDIQAAARNYVKSQADGLDQYLDKVKASILDPAVYGGMPYDSPLVRELISRNLLIQQLSELMKDQHSPDWPLDACAMIALKFLNGAPDEAADLVNVLGKHSSYLAALAAENALSNKRLIHDPHHLKALQRVTNANRNFFGSDCPELYRWALERVAPLAVSFQEISKERILDPYLILTAAPYAELSALKGVQAPPANVEPATAQDEQSNQPDGENQGNAD